LTRLSLAFLDGFQPTAAGRNLGRSRSEACPGLVKALGADIQHFIYTFHDRMPPQALTYNLLALINVELFTYTLKLVHGINELCRNPDARPPALESSLVPCQPELYLDFTAEPGSLSQQMATACVRRDLDAYGQFLKSVITLRLLDRYAEKLARNPRVSSRVEDLLSSSRDSSPDYLQNLLVMANDTSLAPNIDALAGQDEEAIRMANQQAAVDEEEEDLSWLDALLPDGLAPLERVATLLVEAQKRALLNYGNWYWGSGGLLKPHGVLSGTLKGRRAWRYQPSNDLLAVLVQLSSIRPQERIEDHRPRPIRLRDFLMFLSDRFGILIDQPPAPYSGPEAIAAAKENLRAMLRRLRQMGVFRDLSDDFTVQMLQPPYSVPEAVA
jgi:hypothetical protein